MASKTIGKKKAIKSMINTALEFGIDTNYPFYTICTYGITNVEFMEEQLKVNGIHVSERVQMGPVVGTHVGPEGYGMIYIAKK